MAKKAKRHRLFCAYDNEPILANRGEGYLAYRVEGFDGIVCPRHVDKIKAEIIADRYKALYADGIDTNSLTREQLAKLSDVKVHRISEKANKTESQLAEILEKLHILLN